MMTTEEETDDSSSSSSHSSSSSSRISAAEEACALEFPDDQGKNYAKTEFILHARVAEVIGHQLGRVFYDDDTKTWLIRPSQLRDMVLTNILEEGGGASTSSSSSSTLYSRYPIYGSAIAIEPGVWDTTEGLGEGVTYPAASEACLEDVTYCTPEAADNKNNLQVLDLKRNDDGDSLYCPYAYRGPPDQTIYRNCSLAHPEFCPSMDLAVAYDYSNVTVPEAEWYTAPRCLYLRDGVTSGYWTSPYFDAGAGNIHMVTYSQPIISQSGAFLGIATIDVTVDALCYGIQCNPDVTRVRWIGYTLGFLVIILALLLGGWVASQRKHRVVRISQPIFLGMVIVGVLVLASAIFPLGVNETNASQRGCDIACASVPWLVSMGFSLIFVALFSKLWRINRVFTAASQMQRVVVTVKDVMLPFAALMTLNFVLLLSWTLVDPMVYERAVTLLDDGGTSSSSHGRCVPQGKNDEWIIFVSLLAVLNFVALVIVNIQAYKARNINDELSESKYIGLATLSMLQIFIVGLPLLVIVYKDPSAYFFVWCGIIFIVCTTILLLIFVPKVVRWKRPGVITSTNRWSFKYNTSRELLGVPGGRTATVLRQAAATVAQHHAIVLNDVELQQQQQQRADNNNSNISTNSFSSRSFLGRNNNKSSAFAVGHHKYAVNEVEPADNTKSSSLGRNDAVVSDEEEEF